MFFLISAIIGILLGLRFKVFVLIPATLIASCTVIATGHSFKAIVLTLLATAALLQVGYVLGCVIRAYTDRHLPERSRIALFPGRENLRPVDHSRFGAAE
jgi:hypothetical protein